jgi:nitrate/nitrite-specific signal transduction histidine kinase
MGIGSATGPVAGKAAKTNNVPDQTVIWVGASWPSPRRHPLQGNLRNKIIAWSFVPTAIILVMVALVSLYAYQKVTEKLVIERDRELTRLAAQLLGSELAAYTDPLADQFLAIFDGVIFFDAEGQVLMAEPMQYEKRRPSWFRDLTTSRPLQQGTEPIFSDVVVDRLQGDKMVVVVIPFGGESGTQSGGMAGFFRLGKRGDSLLYRSIEKLKRGESTSIYLVDSSGQVIYHSNPQYIGHDFGEQLPVEMVLEGWAGAHRTRDLTDQEIVASFAPVPGTTWGLVIEENWTALIGSSRRYGQLLLGLLGLGIIVPTLIVTIGVRRITQPISDLITAAQEIASGHFGRRIQASTGDELEELAQQFNLMASQLQESYAHLEQKVTDRTKELATLNAIAAQASHSLELEEILNDALDEVLEAVGMDTGQAYHLEEESGMLVPMAQRGLARETQDHEGQVPLEGSLVGQAAEREGPVVMYAGERPGDALWGTMEGEDLALIISVPLIAQGRTVGAINLGNRASRSTSPEEMSLLASIGQQIGMAVENARLYDQAQQLAVMKERNRLARDLHDSVTQALYGVTLYAEAATRQLASGEAEMAAEHLGDIRSTAQESLREMRLLIFELRLPMLKREGLAAALQARLEAVEGRLGMETQLEVEGKGPITAETEEGFYRIAQEALNNALKHAQAKKVSVRLQHNGQKVRMEIQDDGIGFEPAEAGCQGGYGLRTMEERAARLGGKLTVESRPGEGTRIGVEVRQCGGREKATAATMAETVTSGY